MAKASSFSARGLAAEEGADAAQAPTDARSVEHVERRARAAEVAVADGVELRRDVEREAVLEERARVGHRAQAVAAVDAAEARLLHAAERQVLRHVRGAAELVDAGHAGLKAVGDGSGAARAPAHHGRA